MGVHLDPEGFPEAHGHSLQPPHHEVAYLGLEGPHRAREAGRVGDDVGGRAGRKLSHGDHRGLQRVHVSGHDGLQRRDEVGARHDGVDPLIGERPVDPSPLDDELEGVRVGVADPPVQPHPPRREIVIHVQGEDAVDPRVVQRAGLDHAFRSAGGLFGRLEDELQAAPESRQQARLDHALRHAEHDGGVAVVAARVHDPIVDGPVRDVVQLRHGKRIDVGPEGQGRPAGLAL